PRAVSLSRLRLARMAARQRRRVAAARSPALADRGRLRPHRRPGGRGPGSGRCPKGRQTVTDQERQKAEELISRLETAVGQVFPRDGGNAALITTMIQTLNGLRSLLGIVRPH